MVEGAILRCRALWASSNFFSVSIRGVFGSGHKWTLEINLIVKFNKFN